jgi:Flp pilus assembly protein TadG
MKTQESADSMTPSSLHTLDKTSRAKLPTRPRSIRGQSLVEFSLIMPVLFLAMTGMLSFGMTMHDYLVLTNGVNSGAQVLSMSRGQTTDPCATASAAVQSAAPSLTTANLSYTISVNGTSYTGTTCTTGALNMVQGTTAKVTVGYPCVLAVYGLSAPACGLKATTSELIQ